MNDTAPQRITSVSKEISKNPSFNKTRLEELLTAIFSKTSYPNTPFNNSVEDYSESSKKAEVNNICVKQNANSSRFLLRIQLVGNSTIWIVNMTFHNSIQGNISGFFKELRAAAALVCEEENKKLPLVVVDTKEETLPPNPETKDEGLNPDEVAKTVTKIPGIKKRKRVRTASIITDKVIIEILEAWKKHSGGIHRISQREFGTIVSKLGITISNNLLVAFLKKKGVVNVISIERRPDVELTTIGIGMLEKRKEKLALEELETKKIKRMEEVVGFAKKSLSPLCALQKQRNMFIRLDELAIAEKNAEEKIIELRNEILRLEGVLTKINVARKSYFEKIRKIGDSVDHAIIDELIATVEDSSE